MYAEYFRSMLLMGWRESSDDMTSLTMPVKYNVLKAVIDFMYTDEFPVTVKGPPKSYNVSLANFVCIFN